MKRRHFKSAEKDLLFNKEHRRGKEGGGRKKRVKGGQMVTDGDLTWGDEHTIQCTDNVV